MIYFSKELLNNVYSPEEVLCKYTTSGTHTIKIKISGMYEIEAISGGGGGGGVIYDPEWGVSVFGGTGCYYKGKFYINAGTYTISIGAGGSPFNAGGSTSFENVLILNAGSGSVHSSYNVMSSSGGTLNYAKDGVTNVTYLPGRGGANEYAQGGNSTGNPYPGYSQDALIPSLWEPLNAYGKGGGFNSTDGRSGSNGYMKVTYKGRT